MKSRSAVAFLLLFFVAVHSFSVEKPKTTLTWELMTTASSSFSDDVLPSFMVQQRASSSVSTYDQEVVLQAAASITRDACLLLGVKSVGVDYGLVRTGVAATVGYNPKPLEILSDLNTTEVCQRVVGICRSEQAQQVIVGLPLHKNGTEAEQTNLTRIFATELATQIFYAFGPGCPVYFWDERYTSKEAAARAHSRDPSQWLYGTLDAEAACIILENYYHDNGVGAERVEVSEEAMQVYENMAKKRIQEEMAAAQAAIEERAARLQWKMEAMEQDRLQELKRVEEEESLANGKKKKKKKGKRKR